MLTYDPPGFTTDTTGNLWPVGRFVCTDQLARPPREQAEYLRWVRTATSMWVGKPRVRVKAGREVIP